jgi:hypothetical protein
MTRGEKLLAWLSTSITMVKLKTIRENIPVAMEFRIMLAVSPWVDDEKGNSSFNCLLIPWVSIYIIKPSKAKENQAI